MLILFVVVSLVVGHLTHPLYKSMPNKVTNQSERVNTPLSSLGLDLLLVDLLRFRLDFFGGSW